MIHRAAAAAIGLLLLTVGYIDLELSLDLPGWHANAPVADACALALLGLALTRGRAAWRDVPRPRAWAAFLAVGALSAALSFEAAASLHGWIRKPLFLFLAYGVGVASWARTLGFRGGVGTALLAGMGSTALVSIVTSVGRLAAGNALWFSAITGLTPNHKAIAVALAGALPLLLGLRDAWPERRAAATAVVGLVAIAIALSLSKTAWITAALGLGLFWPAGRPLARRWWLTAPALAVALVMAVYAPVLLQSKTMLDAARSRHSLNKRAWSMVVDRPLLGQGPETSVLLEQVTFPDYRINGVDAHGAIQKVASETGVLGLGAWGAFTVGTGLALRRRWRAAGGAFTGMPWATTATFCTLHANLLLSTETFSPTHWGPLALAWGLSHPSEEAS